MFNREKKIEKKKIRMPFKGNSNIVAGINWKYKGDGEYTHIKMCRKRSVRNSCELRIKREMWRELKLYIHIRTYI